jgi:hypothetical protein
MTEQPNGQSTEPAAETPSPAATPPPEPAPSQTFEERMERFGREAGEAGERFGRRAEAAADRWSKDPGVVHAADTASRIWGVILLAVGLWFFADITLGYDMPGIAWRDVWPLALVGIGLLVLIRGMTRRRT